MEIDPAGEDQALVERLVEQAPGRLAPGGTLLLGINTWHLTDDVVTACIERTPMRLDRRWYGAERVAPNGPSSQVYVLTAASAA